MNNALIEIKNITKRYEMGDNVVMALQDVSLTIRKGEYLSIMGPSGSGKSTFMNILGCLDTPSTGEYKFAEFKLRQGVNLVHVTGNGSVEFIYREATL